MPREGLRIPQSKGHLNGKLWGMHLEINHDLSVAAPTPITRSPRSPYLCKAFRFLMCEERKVGWDLFHFKVYNMPGYRLFHRMIIFKVMN